MKPETEVKYKISKTDKSQVTPIKQQKETQQCKEYKK